MDGRRRLGIGLGLLLALAGCSGGAAAVDVGVAALDVGAAFDGATADTVTDVWTAAETPAGPELPGPGPDAASAFATGAPAALAACAARHRGFETCCRYQAAPETWVFQDAPCPGATDCAADTDCPPGYAETAAAERWCVCRYGDAGEGACDDDGACPPESLIAGSGLRRCTCEPLAAGVCEDPDLSFDWGDGCQGYGGPYGCPQDLPPGYPDTAADITEFCTDCACPAVDHALPLRTAEERLALSLPACLAADAGACCTFDAERRLLVVSDGPCPGFHDCDLARECPGGYTESTDAAGVCLCRPNAAGACAADPPAVAEVAAGERCPPPAEGAVMYRCPMAAPDTGAAFCSVCPCPLVDRPLRFPALPLP
jgi:hypothetical protein